MNEGTLEVLAEGKYFRFVSYDGWEYAERKNITGIVTIVAVNERNELVLVEQYRPAVRSRAIELPAGLVGDIEGEESESLETAAERELLEETGYQADSFEFLIESPISTGATNEILTFFLAKGIEKVEEGGGDDNEDIQVLEIPLETIEEFLKTESENGKMIDCKLYSGLYFVRDLLARG